MILFFQILVSDATTFFFFYKRTVVLLFCEIRATSLPKASGFEWIGPNELLAIIDSTDSEARGTWLVSLIEGTEPKRLLDQPIYSRPNPKNPMQKLIFAGGEVIFQALRNSFQLDVKTGVFKPIKLNLGALLPLQQAPRGIELSDPVE